MATYYVKNAGDDAKDGLSDANAWKTVAKVQGSSFSGDDNIYFNRDDEWREQLFIPSSGTSGHQITFGAYGSGADPIINGANVYNTNDWTLDAGNVWYMNHPLGDNGSNTVVVIDGTRYSPVASKGALTTNKFFVDTTPSPDVLYVYLTDDPDNHTTEVTARLYGIGLLQRQYVTIENIETRYCGYAGIRPYNAQANGYCIFDGCTLYHNRISGIQIYNGHENNTVQNCTATYNGNGFYSNQADNNTFQNCLAEHNIHYLVAPATTDGHGYGVYDSDGCVIENCESNDDFQGINVDANNDTNGAILRYNYIHDAQLTTNGITVGLLAIGADIEVYYNLLINNGSSDGWSFGADTAMAGNLYVYNNTMFQNSTTGNGIAYFVNADNCYLKNNIMFSDKAATNVLRLIGGSITSDYNCMYFPNGTNVVYDAGDNYTSVALWNTGSGEDANSVEADPLFADAENNDFSLGDGSPCIDMGVDVSLTEDYDGNTVPMYSNPDIGAHEYVGLEIHAILRRG